MNNSISLDQMLNNLKAKNEESNYAVESAEKTTAIINKLVNARINLGLTQRDLAKKCGIKQPALARIETLKVIPQLNTVIRIAEAVGVKIEAYTDSEKQKLLVYSSIGEFVFSSLPYNIQNLNNDGDYSWKQNSMAFQS